MHHAVRSPSATELASELRPVHPAVRGAARRAVRSTRSPRAARALAFALLLPTLGLASCSLPAVQSSDLSQGELMLELSDALAGMRSTDADLQAQVDSLRAVVARQDSLLSRLAAATGVPVR